MAGDWIAIRTDIFAVPEVSRLSRMLGWQIDATVGRLVQFWAWATAHTEDGTFVGLDLADVAAASSVPTKLLESLLCVGWLQHDSTRGVVIPNFDRWISESAKRRMKEAAKKRKQRTTKALRRGRDRPQSVPNLSPKCPRENGTRGEERREELIKTSASADVSSELARPPTSEAAEPKPPPADVVLVFPCAGKAASWPLNQRQIDAWVAAYPGVDVAAECRKAWAWVEASPKRRKTAAGMPRFLVAWLNRATDRGPPRTVGAVAGGASEIDWRKLL